MISQKNKRKKDQDQDQDCVDLKTICVFMRIIIVWTSVTKLAHKMPREGPFLTSHQKVKEKSLSK